MQPLDDDELRARLREWRAPTAPPGLERRIFVVARPSPVRRWAQWLLTGSVRVPAPVCAGVALALLLLALRVWSPPRRTEPSVDMFQPVEELRPRLIRTRQ